MRIFAQKHKEKDSLSKPLLEEDKKEEENRPTTSISKNEFEGTLGVSLSKDERENQLGDEEINSTNERQEEPKPSKLKKIAKALVPEEFSVEEDDSSEGEPINLFGVSGSINLKEKKGELKIEGWSFPDKVPGWPLEADIDFMIPGVPGVSVYAGVSVDGGIEIGGKATIKKDNEEQTQSEQEGEESKDDWHVDGLVGMEGELGARAEAGIKLGSNWVASLSAGLFAGAKIGISEMGGITTSFYFENKKIKSDKKGFNFKYNLENEVSAEVGGEIKGKAFRIFSVKFYEVKFKEWKIGTFSMEGEVVRDEYGNFKHNKSTEKWLFNTEKGKLEVETTTKEGKAAKEALLEAGRVYGSKDERLDLAKEAEQIGKKYEKSLNASIENIKKYEGKLRKYFNKIEDAKKHVNKHENRLKEHESVREDMLNLNEEGLSYIFSKHAIESVKKTRTKDSELGEDLRKYTEQRMQGKFFKKNKQKHSDRMKRYDEAKKGEVYFTNEDLQRIYSKRALKSAAYKKNKEKDDAKSMEDYIREYTKSRIDVYNEKLKTIDDKTAYYEAMKENALKEAVEATHVLADVEAAIKAPDKLEEGVKEYMDVIRKEYLYGEARNENKEIEVNNQEKELETIDQTIQKEVEELEKLASEETEERGDQS